MALTGVHHLVMFIRIATGDNTVQEVLDILDSQHVKSQQVTTIPFSDGQRDQVMFIFSCSRTLQSEIGKALKAKGIGEYGSGSDISVLPLALAKDVRHQRDKIADAAATNDVEDPTPNTSGTALSVFQSTIKARIAVENMLEIVHEGASFSFDFFMLIIVAASLALIGLLTNSSVTLVASMLVSPMMGPILGFTFGSVVRDRALILTGLRSEAASLFLCILVGYIGGLAAAPAAMRQYPWPTLEMSNRGDPSALYVGAAIAIPSGVGVALSIMGQNTNSLVGVAISASLLPPCVNCGLLWAEATLASYYYESTCIHDSVNTATWQQCCDDLVATTSCPQQSFQDFCCTNTYWSPSAIASMGGISMALTLVNIMCIWVFGALTFLLKEVAPLPNKSELWSSLVPKARKFNLAVIRGDIKADALKEEIRKEEAIKAGRFHMGGHKLTRDIPIGKGALQGRQIGAAATGMVFPTQGFMTRPAQKGISGDLFTNLRALYAGNEVEADDEKGEKDLNV